MKKNRFILFILTIALVIFASGCGASNGTNGKTPDPASITDSIQKQITYAGMYKIDTDQLASFYTIKADILDKYSIYIANSGSADELAVFKLKDASKAADAKKSVQERIEQKKSDFENYNADEFHKIQKCVVETRGNYVFFTISSDPAKAKSIFDGFFK